MSVYSRSLCITALLSLLVSSTVSASIPISSNATSSSLRSRQLSPLGQPDEEGWLHLDSIGMMLPMGEQDDALASCSTVECQQHDSSPPTQPDFQRRSLPISGSRDLVKRNATITFGKDGQPTYKLHDNDDDGEERDDLADDEDQDMQKRSASPSFLSSLFKRKSKSSRKAKSSKKSKSKSKAMAGGKSLASSLTGDLDLGATLLTTITWYTGHDLLNPYCDRQSHWTPTDDSLIIAVTQKWSSRPACGEFMEITTQDKGKKQRSIIARIVDLCGGCIPEVPHADLSKAAFQQLYNLNVGKVTGLKMRRVSGPKGPWSNKLYGPRNL